MKRNEGRPAGLSNFCVIGGGPAGLASAIALAQSGYRTTVIDRAVPPVDKPCGEGLMPDSIAALEQLGVKLPFDMGFRFRGIRFLDGRSCVQADFPAGVGIGVRRVVLHEALLARARELDIECLWGVNRIIVNGTRVKVDGREIASDFLVGADGQDSRLRRFGGLHEVVRERRRFAFRSHYQIPPWSAHVEIYWGATSQIYVTPVSNSEVCVVAMSRDSKLRLNDAVEAFPQLRERLATAPQVSRERGALSVTRKLRRVCRPGLALVGDASGSVDAITGEGLCLSFRQALSLSSALRSGKLDHYQLEHARMTRRTRLTGALMMTLDGRPGFQRRALASLAVRPRVFESLVAVHVGTQSFSDLFSWQLVHLCRAFLTE